MFSELKPIALIISKLPALALILSLSSCVPTTYPISTQTTPVDEKPATNNFIHQEGQKLIDGQGREIVLKGTIVEGWLQWQGPVLNCGLESESAMEKKLVDLVGQAEFDKFKAGIYRNFMREKDVIEMKKLGFNVVRVAFNHTLLEDDANPYHYKESGWKILDELIQNCENHKLYVVLDFHSVPGGQNPHFISDPDPVKLWQSDENQKRTIALWKAIANRYKDKEIVAGYDLINEPDFPNGAQLFNLYAEITKAIRTVDKKHLIFIEGNKLAHDFSDFTFPLSHNMAYSFHTYHLFTFLEDKSREQLIHLNTIAKAQKVPVWNGEFGANTLEWTRNTVEMLNDPQYQNSGWIFWPWKRIALNDSYRHLYAIRGSLNWDKVQAYFGLFGAKPARDVAIKGLNEMVESVKIENCTIDPEVKNVLK